MASDDRCLPDRLRFRYSAPAAILSKPFQKKFEEETIQQEAVKPGPHPRRKLMKRSAKDFFTTNFIKAFVSSLVSSVFKFLGLSGLILAAATAPAVAQKKYDAGVTDTTIKIGNIMPYSGPASAYGIIGKTMSAYMRMINDHGGVVPKPRASDQFQGNPQARLQKDLHQPQWDSYPGMQKYRAFMAKYYPE